MKSFKWILYTFENYREMDFWFFEIIYIHNLDIPHISFEKQIMAISLDIFSSIIFHFKKTIMQNL